MAASRSMPGRVMRMNQSGKRSAWVAWTHSFLRRPLENGPDLRLEAALVAHGALPQALLGGVGQFSDDNAGHSRPSRDGFVC